MLGGRGEGGEGPWGRERESETVIRQRRGECAKMKAVSQRDTEKAE